MNLDHAVIDWTQLERNFLGHPLLGVPPTALCYGIKTHCGRRRRTDADGQSTWTDGQTNEVGGGREREREGERERERERERENWNGNGNGKM